MTANEDGVSIPHINIGDITPEHPTTTDIQDTKKYPSQLLHRRIRIDLPMLADSQHGADLVLTLNQQPHDAARGSQAPPDVQQLALDADDGAGGHGPQVGDVEGAADAEPLPVAGAGDEAQRQRRAQVEDGGGAPAVQVAEPVAVRGLHGEEEGDLWLCLWLCGRRRVRVDGEVREDGGCPVLWAWGE